MVSITFLSNAGVLLDLDGTRLMIDGLYSAQGLPFSDVPEELMEGVAVDYLAFTHTHHDHLDQRKLEDYLAAHAVKGLLLPPRVRSDLHGARAQEMKGTEGVAMLSGITVRWYRTPHLDHARPEHYSFLVEGGGATVLVAGDAMPAREQFARMAAGEKIDAMLVIPTFLQEPEGRALLREVLKPTRLFLYHIPRAEDDIHGLRGMAAHQTERWGEEYRMTALLTRGSVGPNTTGQAGCKVLS